MEKAYGYSIVHDGTRAVAVAEWGLHEFTVIKSFTFPVLPRTSSFVPIWLRDVS